MKSKKKQYGDIKFYHPDGDLMFIHNEHKVQQYLKKDLITIVESETDDETGEVKIKGVKFNFEPNGKGVRHPYFLAKMENICVVCGDDNFENLTRHHVFPDCYKEELPEKIKANNHYDLFRICIKHHDEYEVHAQQLKREIAKELGVTAPDGKSPENDKIKEKKKTSGIANQLISNKSKIPKDKIDNMYQKISKATGLSVDELTSEKLIEISQEKNKMQAMERQHLHGYQVMQKITDLQSFVERWRKHFVEFAKPKFLPKLWTIEGDVYQNSNKDEE